MSIEPMSEGGFKRQMMLALSGVGFTVFNNPVGTVVAKSGDHVRFGLSKGSSDIVGWRTGTIVRPGTLLTFDNIRVAVFCAFEIKTRRGRPTKEQQHFIEVLNEAGGFAVVVKAPGANPTNTECRDLAARIDNEWKTRYGQPL